MQLHQLRSATLLLTLGEHRLLVDPMLSPVGAMPGFKMFGGGRQRNPLVPLPSNAGEALGQANGVLVTHEHPDHLDGAGLAWIREQKLPVWACAIDAKHLRQRGLEVRELESGGLGVGVEVIPSRHARGALGWMLGPVSGVYLAHPNEPSVYLTGDAVLTPELLDTVKRLQPEVLVAPAGAANFGLGGDILFSVDDLFALARLTPGRVVLNHLEALDHCPTRRESLRQRVQQEGLTEKILIPDDGEVLSFSRTQTMPHVAVRPPKPRKPGLQKWLTAFFA